MTAYQLSDSEAAVINAVRYVSQTNGFGEVNVVIKNGQIVMSSLTLDVKISKN